MLNVDNQAAVCCRAIIRFVNSNKNLPGDKLPTQYELSGILGFCHNTMTPTMDKRIKAVADPATTGPQSSTA